METAAGLDNIEREDVENIMAHQPVNILPQVASTAHS